MSSGQFTVPPATGPERDAHTQFLEHLLAEPKFVAAVKAYTKENDTFDVPFLGGSNNAGDTVYFDRRFVEAVNAGQIKYEGKPYDPRPFVRLHEAVEGAFIRQYGANYDTDNKQGLPGGHLVATWAERRAVEHAGMEWAKYETSLKPWIAKDEHEKATNPPPDLLLKPYDGTPQAKEVGDEAGKTGAKQAQASVNYGQAKPGGDTCGRCRHYQPGPHCEIVQDPMTYGPQGWCNQFEANDMKPLDTRGHALSIASATHLHKAGHMPSAQRDKIHSASKAEIAKQKKAGPAPKPMPAPFGSLAPMTDDGK